MGRPFIIYVNLSNILKDQKETHYTMYIDDTKMTIVYELKEWIRWIFSLTHCVYLTHENSIIHELEDIKILSVLRNVKVQNCHVPCVHTKFNHLFKNLSIFTQWDGIRVPKLFLNKVNEITQKFIQKDSSIEVRNGCDEEETATSNERKVESNKMKELCLSNINTCKNQLSENSNSNMCGSSKTNFNINSNIKLDETVVKKDNSNKVHLVPPAKSEFVDVCNNSTTNFNMNSNIKLDDTRVGVNNSNKIHSPLSDKYEFVNVNSINKANLMGSDIKLYDTTIPMDTSLEMKNSNKVQSVMPDENKFVNAPIKISESEIEQIQSLVDIKLSASTEDNDDEDANKSNRKRMQSILHDKKLNCNKIIKKGPKPFSVGEILTSLRSELNTTCNGCESNTFPTEHNQNSSLSNGLINNKLKCSDQDSPNNMDVIVTKIKRKRIRRHRSKRLMSRGSKLDNLPKHEQEYTSESVTSYTPYYTKQSSHIRFTSDDEDSFETNNPESDKQPEKTQHELSKNNELTEKGIQQSPLITKKEETLSTTPPNACNKNDESKVDECSEANKEFSTLDKLILLHDPSSSSDSSYKYSNEENQHINGVPKTPDNYDFNLSTLKALKEKFPSPMVVERFY